MTDYHYRKVYKLYLKHLLETKQQGKSDVFERALSVWGFEIDKGDALWQLYSEYCAETEPSKVATITRRRCAKPVKGSDVVFDAYIKKEVDPAKVERTTQAYKYA